MTQFIQKPVSNLAAGQRRLISGWGVNDATYITNIDIDGKRKTCPQYSVWVNMVHRGYSEKVRSKYPTYKDVTICEEWRSFSAFKSWMDTQEWNGKDLDKDILVIGNKHYSPETCCFVEHSINSMLIDCGAARGFLPQGVTFHSETGKYRARCRVKGGIKYLGLHITAVAASKAYWRFKSEVVSKAANKMADVLIKNGLLNHAREFNERSY
jgi:hypothetical protein